MDYTPLGPFALHAPSHRTWLADSGLAEKALLCVIMMVIAGVDWVLCEISFGLFLFDSLPYSC